MCLILARDEGWTCVSNDGPLRRACSASGATVMWGLQMMLELVAAGGLEVGEAIAVAEAIAAENRWIGTGVIEAFKRKARKW